MKLKEHVLDICSFISLLGAIYFYQVTQDLVNDLSQYRQANLNITESLDQEGVVFNRVPKVGSEMFWAILDKLATLNNFTSYSDSPEVKRKRKSENTFLATQTERRHYFDIIQLNLTKPYTYTKHLNYIDFTEFNVTNPIYINLVRHPVDRVISWYYYNRAPWHIVRWDQERNDSTLSPNAPSLYKLKRTFEECVLDREDECRYEKGQSVHHGRGGSHYSQIAFFCGHHWECEVFESPKALARAKANVEKSFAVVGDLSALEKSLTVFEAYLPRYFKGVHEVYFDHMKGAQKNKNIYKPKTSRVIRNQLLGNFTLEIQFYEFCQQRLHRQYLAITE
ncbi:hypothetical protein TCAL_12114 [Tigriopus californicus]|uniref:Sulfotransferase domain-containing protein n=1 Tax=Tigriopus californicus TaxID=6832 RepID=A0A553P1Z3_TIGCA|nr:heparan sulfate 2-O-sulfotransferase pipe-like [Tigriopus californicus]TRY71670.1 hypothetical protein TCAL_12114 [Tigriopus californicus]|eukprot:TCALIF_12114-PA protein Name:"Similar to pip Heparan sulfate 2-O-sulfotransferase pipe (Drosophila melanogaster)" AED:0.01 eAED:0.01 QI:0/-1/0/1/-1/1/1/0/335